MPLYNATVDWERSGSVFTDHRYSREHKWSFDGGVVVPASSSPHSVRVPLSNPSNVDPEEAYVAALSSCHMLWFLSLAAADGFVVDRYTDSAEGVLENDAHGRKAMTRITLQPAITFSGERKPDESSVERLHHAAHEACFLANSVRTEITIHGKWTFQE